MSDDENQIEVPASFVQLYTAPGGHRLLKPAHDIRERYEVCEDLAQMLAQRASAAHFKTDCTEGEVLVRIGRSLAASEAPLPAAEVSWVVTRLAEILGWPAPSR